MGHACMLSVHTCLHAAFSERISMTAKYILILTLAGLLDNIHSSFTAKTAKTTQIEQ